ncbi:MAG TPA: hypothetical protein VKX39_16095 [Bryobacteraceae bacterium]|jgi:hypothetical protein|nr:hypothetical protein [Bryobacteraceae bacterium]
MTARLSLFAALSAALLAQLPMEPPHTSGQSITGAFEGWFKNDQGTFLLLGYYNRNSAEAMDIPVGPDNHIDPGGPDYGQPTHFLPGRAWGIFTIKVPPDFGDKKLTWTIVANGKPTVIPMSLATDWEVSPFVQATGNTPPYLSFSESGPFVNGPVGTSSTVETTVGAPLAITLWVADDAHVVPGMNRPKTPPVVLTWSKYRGPGDVTIKPVRPPVEKAEFSAPKTDFTGKATTTASFSQPGDYILHVTANDWTGEGGGGFQCCWSNAKLKVSVKP